jgi:hypothetical protein
MTFTLCTRSASLLRFATFGHAFAAVSEYLFVQVGSIDVEACIVTEASRNADNLGPTRKGYLGEKMLLNQTHMYYRKPDL